jgi:2-polyprenyl-3-methyl-5-hydroxy-6-metoxy-1,4-benzoquinol methylase
MLTAATESVRCNLCGGQEHTLIYDQVDRIKTVGTQVVQCNGCGLVYLNPRLKHLADNFSLSDSYLYDFYLPYYERLGTVTATGEVIPANNQAMYYPYLARMASYRQTNRVLDVGCAIGLFLAAAKAEGWESIGIEPSAPLSRYGKERLGQTILEHELQTVRFPNHHFDVVTLWGVAEHLLDPFSVFREVFRVMRPGGLLMLNVPNWNSLARELLGPLWEMFVTDHFYYFTPQTLALLLAKSGFRPLQVAAGDLIEAEIEEIAQKGGQDLATYAVQQLAAPQATAWGSTVTAIAEKPMTTQGRVERALHLLRNQAWHTLGQEVRNYLHWQWAQRNGHP